MTKEELEKEIEDWWRIKFRVELKDDVCQKLTTDEAEELCNKIVEPREKRIEELKAQIEKMKQELDTAREEAIRQEQWELYSVLNGIYNDNFEVTTSVSN